MENPNLFSCLFTYRPRASRNPLEDFCTEILAYLLRNESILLDRYLDLLCWRTECKRSKVEIKTQHTLSTGKRVDLACFWREADDTFSIFVEHKAWSSPWEIPSESGSIENQINHYCKFQFDQNQRIGMCNHFVALVSPYHFDGYTEDNSMNITDAYTELYKGNLTWQDIEKLLVEQIDFAQPSIKLLISEFIAFLRDNDMTFDRYTDSELSSIKHQISYFRKLGSLNNIVVQDFGLIMENLRSHFRLLRKDVYGEYSRKGHRGIVLYDIEPPEDARFWLFVGLSTLYESDVQWWPKLIMAREMIPDVEVRIYMSFDEEKARESFLDSQIGINPSCGFNVIRAGEADLNLSHRRSLKDFVSEPHQIESILSFLAKGLEPISDGNSNLSKSIEKFLGNNIPNRNTGVDKLG